MDSSAPAGGVVALSVGDSLQTGFDSFFGYLPNVLGFLVVLLVGWVVARVVGRLVAKALQALHVDEALRESPVGGFVERAAPRGRPSRLVGAVVFWLVFLFALTAAIGALQIPAVTGFMNSVLAYLPRVVAAILILVVAALLAGAAVAAVQRTLGDTPTGRLVSAVVPGLVLAVAVFMALTQLGIAPVIVTITYAALLGFLALTGALAFGLGGREVAAEIWRDAYDKGRDQADQAREDLRVGRERARRQLAERREAEHREQEERREQERREQEERERAERERSEREWAERALREQHERERRAEAARPVPPPPGDRYGTREPAPPERRPQADVYDRERDPYPEPYREPEPYDRRAPSSDRDLTPPTLPSRRPDAHPGPRPDTRPEPGPSEAPPRQQPPIPPPPSYRPRPSGHDEPHADEPPQDRPY